MQKTQFKKVQSFTEVLSAHFTFSGKVVVDVGCGTGDLVRWFAKQGAQVTGIDLPALIEKALVVEKVGNENYIIATAQDLPFKANFADIIIFLASFHHVHEEDMQKALDECYRILKPQGCVVFIEPVLQDDSYYQLTRLVEDEVEIQRIACNFIREMNAERFQHLIEDYYFVERSFQDFVNLINIYVPDKDHNEDILKRAKQIVETKNEPIETVKFQSRARLNILLKK